MVWDLQDQAPLQNRRFDWSSNPDKAPKTLDILYAQEDLWVLNALMRIVANTNRDATARYNAIIKEFNTWTLVRTVGRNHPRDASRGGRRHGMSGSGGGRTG